jgi:Arc/MetJ family transcription regulator
MPEPVYSPSYDLPEPKEAPPSWTWNHFEVRTLVCLIIKGEHKVSKDPMDLTDKLNHALNPASSGGQPAYSRDVPHAEVQAMLKRILSKKLHAVDLSERDYSAPVTRTKLNAFMRNLGFDGSKDEWDRGRKKHVRAETEKRLVRYMIRKEGGRPSPRSREERDRRRMLLREPRARRLLRGWGIGASFWEDGEYLLVLHLIPRPSKGYTLTLIQSPRARIVQSTETRTEILSFCLPIQPDTPPIPTMPHSCQLDFLLFATVASPLHPMRATWWPCGPEVLHPRPRLHERGRSRLSPCQARILPSKPQCSTTEATEALAVRTTRSNSPANGPRESRTGLGAQVARWRVTISPPAATTQDADSKAPEVSVSELDSDFCGVFCKRGSTTASNSKHQTIIQPHGVEAGGTKSLCLIEGAWMEAKELILRR